MGSFNTVLDWKVLPGGKRRLNEPLMYSLDTDLAEKIGLTAITVPAGFVTDGYSFPRPVGWPSFLGGKFEVAPEAAVAHDYLCENPEITGSRYLTDLVLFRGMKDKMNEEPSGRVARFFGSIRRGLIFAGVRAYAIVSGKGKTPKAEPERSESEIP